MFSVILETNYSFVQMAANGLAAKRENTGTKKSPLQIQMLERFYSGKYMLTVQALPLIIMLIYHCWC